MEYQEFLDAIAWTKDKWKRRKPTREPRCQKYACFNYSALRERGDDYWLHLEKMDEAKLGKEIIDCFLNTKKWACRLPSPDTDKGIDMVKNLRKAVDQIEEREYYAVLKGFRIEDINLQGCCVHQGVEKPILYIIDSIYSIFRQVKPKFGAVATSKLMHMALPNLFIMWDDMIIKEYGVRKQVLPYFERAVWSYTAFLILMQENIHHIKETNPGGSSLTNQVLFQQINQQCGEKGLSITRLLDIANYAVSREKNTYQKCHRCIEVTKHRLEALAWYVELAKPKKPFFDC